MKFTEEQARQHAEKQHQAPAKPRNYWCPKCFDRKKPVNRLGIREVNGVLYCETCALSAPAPLAKSLQHAPGLHCDRCAKIPIFEGEGGICGCGGTFRMVEGPSAKPPKAPIHPSAAQPAGPGRAAGKIPGQHSGGGVLVKPRRAKSPNRTEREYELMLKAAFPAAIVRWEAYTLRLADRCRYSPDFSVLHPSGALEFYEVKGEYVFPKALVKLRMAAEQFDHPFTLAQKLKSGWVVTSIAGRRK